MVLDAQNLASLQLIDFLLKWSRLVTIAIDARARSWFQVLKASCWGRLLDLQNVNTYNLMTWELEISIWEIQTHISFTIQFLEKSFVITIVTRLGKRYLENNPLIIKVTKQSFYLLFKLQQYKKYSFSIKKINK